MPRATERLTALALAALVSLAALLVLGQGTARASDRDLGWLRLTPDQGRIDVAVDATTQSRCPKGEAVVVSVAGPGVPRNDDIGYIVGNTAISALTPQGSGQLTVPLALTFKDWFADNAPGVKPKGTYTLTLVCRDRLRGSKTYGEYVAQVAIAGGKFRALGAAAQPAAQPSAPAPSSPAAQPGAGSGTSATPAASAPAASAPASAAPSAAATSGGPAPAGTSPAAGSPAVQPAAAASADEGGGARLLLLGLVAAAIATVGIVLLRGRDAPTGQHTSSGSTDSS
jgi:hypothetical protein